MVFGEHRDSCFVFLFLCCILASSACGVCGCGDHSNGTAVYAFFQLQYVSAVLWH